MAYPLLFLTPAILPALDMNETFSFLLPLMIPVLVLSLIFRWIREKAHDLCQCFSAIHCILLIYVLALLAASFLPGRFNGLLTSLPFISWQEHSAVLFSFSGSVPAEISAQVLSMLILTLNANISCGLIPPGERLLSRLLLRILTLGLTLGIHCATMWILDICLPGVLTSRAPMILLVILAVFLLIGVLRFLLGLVLTIANPIFGAIYAFFFSNKVGKQLSRSVLSTFVLTGLTCCLQHLGISRFNLSDSLLPVLMPVSVVLAVLWLTLCKE